MHQLHTTDNNNNNNDTNSQGAANVLMRISVKQKCFQFVLESVQRGIRRPQIVWQTVPHGWSTDREANKDTNNTNAQDHVMVLSSQQSHCESSSNECRAVLS